GDDILSGGLGRDVLIGGVGRDRFVYHSRSQRSDRINDFSPVADTIVISARGFGGGLRRGVLLGSQFRVGAVARDANDRFIYNRATGVLWFDADGIGAGARIPIAALDAGLAMTNADIFVTA
nr:calcium-binding protein [Hydrococcus sp. Prado102]